MQHARLLSGFLVSTMLLALLAVSGPFTKIDTASAAHSTITCDRSSANIGDDVHCTVTVTRPSGDTGATHINVGLTATGPTHVVSVAAHGLIPYCIVGYIPSDGGHSANCFNYNPYAQAPAPYITLPYNTPIPLTYTIHIDSCGSGAQAGTTVANVYGVNSPWQFFPIQVPSCNQQSSSSSPQQNQMGCIDVLKETFTAQGNILTPVAPFSFRLDGNQIMQNDQGGHARFTNVSPGQHQVTELSQFGWNQILVTPSNGILQVPAGQNCVAVVFKNRQNSNNSSSSSSRPQCSDNRDNDNDGLMDYQDPGCYTNGIYNPNDNDESNQMSSSSSSQRPQCSDNIDNDYDNLVDYQDPGCYTNGVYNPNDNSESNQTSSSSSSSSSSSNYRPQCSDGRDNDYDGKIDYADPGCYTNGSYNPNDNNESNGNNPPCYGWDCHSSSSSSSSPTQYQYQCWDGIDNDHDGRTDMQDPGCTSPYDNDESNSSPCYGWNCHSSSSSSSSSSSNPYQYQCWDGLDNDHDGRIDLQDPGCTSAYDNDETNTVTPPCYGWSCHSSSSSSSFSYRYQCWDGIDNDYDGRIDLQDPGCTSAYDNDERNQNNQPCYGWDCGSNNAGGWWGGQNNQNNGGWPSYEQNADVNANANTNVNSTINADSQNNTTIWQNGWGDQNVDVNTSADTDVNSNINADSQNSTNVYQYGGW